MWVIDLYCRLFHSGSSNHISESELYVFLSHIFVFYCLFFVCYCIMSILWKHRRMLNSKKEVSLYCNQSSVQTQMIYERTVVDLSSEIWVSVKAQASLKIEQIWLSLNRCYFLQNTHLNEYLHTANYCKMLTCKHFQTRNLSCIFNPTIWNLQHVFSVYCYEKVAKTLFLRWMRKTYICLASDSATNFECGGATPVSIIISLQKNLLYTIYHMPSVVWFIVLKMYNSDKCKI